MEMFKLKATPRERTGNQVGALRRENKIPAVVYGRDVDNVNLTVDAREFERVYAASGESSLVELSIEGQPDKTVIVRSVQKHPLRGNVIHADLYEIKSGETMEVFIEFEFVGEAPAVKSYGAMLVKSMDGINVRCLPKDLVHSFKVDLETIKEIGDTIQVKDLNLSEGMEILAEPEETIAVANATVEEVDEPVEAANVESVEVIGKGKEEEAGETKPENSGSDKK